MSEMEKNAAAPAATAEAAPVATAEAPVAGDREKKAKEIIRSCAYWSAGAGLIPVPVVDILAVGGVQLYCVRELAKLWEVPFSEDRVKAIIGALLGGGVPSVVSSGAGSLLKAVPVVGTLLSIAVMPGLSAAATLAVGRVFVEHFKTGGTLLDFDAEKMRAFFQAEFEAAQKEVAVAKNEPAAKEEPKAEAVKEPARTPTGKAGAAAA